MKKLVITILFLSLFSCIKDSSSEFSIQDVKYFTRNGVKVGTIIKRDLKDKKVVFLTYPEYSAQSYQLIKYVSSIMNQYDLTGVYLQDFPDNSNNKSINDLLLENVPMLAFDEFVDLYRYFDKNNIQLINSIDNKDGIYLVLSPEDNNVRTEEYIQRNFKKSDILYLCMNGIDATAKVDKVINSLPQGKKYSTVPLTNSRFNALSEIYYAVILMGESKEYSDISPIKLYTKENYMKAPESFINKNKFPIISVQVKRMNNSLNKAIKKSKD